jgi:hypothetical protein
MKDNQYYVTFIKFKIIFDFSGFNIIFLSRQSLILNYLILFFI